jgi:hypothetical protein
MTKDKKYERILQRICTSLVVNKIGKDRNCFMKNACISNTIPNMTLIVGDALTSVKEMTGEKHQQRIDADAILYEKDETRRHAKENVVVKCFPLSSLMNT